LEQHRDNTCVGRRVSTSCRRRLAHRGNAVLEAELDAAVVAALGRGGTGAA